MVEIGTAKSDIGEAERLIQQAHPEWSESEVGVFLRQTRDQTEAILAKRKEVLLALASALWSWGDLVGDEIQRMCEGFSK